MERDTTVALRAQVLTNIHDQHDPVLQVDEVQSLALAVHS